VILDWAPSHFAGDEHGLAEFDGTALYEGGRDGQWNSPPFDYVRPEVRSFLLSSALYWLDRFHFDGLRVDAVAAIRAREGGEAFLRGLTEALHDRLPSAVLIAEDSSPAGGVTASPRDGGHGFDLKWDMGWMHDTLEYFTKPLEARSAHHGRLTFRPVYLQSERWVLPLSHDEVKPPFGSLLKKMPGDLWQQFANVRLLLAWMYAQPGKKLLFMGDEFAQWQEWNHDASLDWHLIDLPSHAQIRNLTGFLNWAYRNDAALYECDADARGFEWVDCCDEANSVVSLLRRGQHDRQVLAAVFNFSAETRLNYRIGAPFGGVWKEVLNTDAAHYGGSGRGNFGAVEASPIPWHNHLHSLNLLLPPLAAIWLKPGAEAVLE
jgi:1,4-alpha-glucan branching enzyme